MHTHIRLSQLGAAAGSITVARPRSEDLSVAGRVREFPLALPSATLANARAVLPLLAICALPILLYAPFFMEPFMRDEGFYASTAQLIIHGEGIPYRDAFDNKPPLIFGWFSASFLLFGENVWAPRLAAALCVSATTGLVYWQGRMIFSHGGGLIAALTFALSIAIAAFQTNANTEYFLVLPLVASLLAFTAGRRSGSWRWYLASGAAAGVAVMTKQVAIFNFLALLAVPVFVAVRAGGVSSLKSADVVRPFAMMAAGFTAALAAVAAPFFIAGAGGDLIDGTVVYALVYSGGSSLETKIDMLIWTPVFLASTAGPWLLMAGLGAVYVWRRGPSSDQWLLLPWLGACALGVSATGRFYGHYFVQALPALALLAPAGVYLLKENWDGRWAKAAALWLLPISAFVPLVVILGMYVQPNPEARHEVKFSSGEEGVVENASPKLAAYVAALTAEGDYIYNLGFQSEIYFYAGRRSPTRFLFDHPFAARRAYEEEALADLARTPPAIIIDSAAYEPDPRATSNYYPALIKEWIDENYDYLGRFYYADLYRLIRRE